MEPNALMKASDSARKFKLPDFFEDRFFNISVERGIAMGIFLNPKGWMMRAGNFQEV